MSGLLNCEKIETQRKIANNHVENHEYGLAYEVFLSCFHSHRNPDDLYNAAENLLFLGETIGAYELLEKELATIENDHPAATARAIGLQARILRYFQCFDEALECLNLSIDMDPESSELYYNRALVFKELKQTDRALKEIGRALKLNREDGRLHLEKARLLEEIGEQGKAIEAFARAAFYGEEKEDALSRLITLYGS